VKSVAACPESALLTAMLDETLSLQDQHTVQEHVDGCPACQTRLDAMVETGEDGQLPLHALSEDSLLAPDQPTRAAAERRGAVFAFLEPAPDSDTLGRLAHYEVLEVVGQGGMGIVFKARDTRLHRIVAIKALAPEFATSGTARQRFLREAQAAAAVSHDHIITIYAVEPGPVPYIVMELIDGRSLQQKIEQSGHLDLVEILRIGYQIAAGLAAAHAQGLIHRDIKPANILLQNGIQRVQITDFGLARAADDAGITRVGEVAGTPQYMSPEQAQGRSVDARSDLFSLGSVLYAMAAGRSPFRAESAVAVLRRVCDESPLPIRDINPEIPPWLASIIDRLLAKDPDERYQTAVEVEVLLGQHLARVQQPFLAPQAAADELPATPNAQPLAAGRRRWAGLIVLLILAGLFAVAEATHLTNFAGRVVPIASQRTSAAPGALAGVAPASDRPKPKDWPADAPPPAKIPFDRDQAAAHQQAWAGYLGVPVEFTNTLGMKLRLIPPGEFVMGGTPAEVAEALEIGDDPFYRETVQSERPQHQVQLSEPWFLGVHEVTQEQYEAVSGENPSYFSPHGGGQYEVTDLDTRSLPVEQVSWNQAAQFCNALSREEGLTEKYAWKGEACTVRPGAGYHLPTEAQWEFACRAGTVTRYWFAATGEQLSAYAWNKWNAAGRTHTVGQLRPNPFGLHDLYGNVSEWCQDGWQLAYYAQFEQQTAVDPTGPSADFFFRVLRGGSHRYQLLANRSAKRGAGGPNFMQDYLGLRVALSVDGVKTLLQAQQEKAPAPPEQPPGPVPRGEPP
jgi:formylglycine-generating enzyme required for sulfatase activity/tRNA A-37 threonylcarbamoyl transferase component Bud32